MSRRFCRNEENRNRLEPWRFVVLFSCSSLRFLLIGSLKSYGVIIPFLAVQLKTSHATIGFIITSQLAVTYLMAPLSNLLIQRLNGRLVAVCGSFLSGLALVATAVAKTAWTMGLCMLISGCCYSVITDYIVIVLKQHFKNSFGFANTITYAGSVIGSLLLPILTMELYVAYGLYGTLCCLGAISLNNVPLSMLMRQPKTAEPSGTGSLQEREKTRSGSMCADTSLLPSSRGNEGDSWKHPKSNVLSSSLIGEPTAKYKSGNTHSNLRSAPGSVGRSTTSETLHFNANNRPSTSYGSESRNGEIADTCLRNIKQPHACEEMTEDESSSIEDDDGEHLALLNSPKDTSSTKRGDIDSNVNQRHIETNGRCQRLVKYILEFFLETISYESIKAELPFSLTILPSRMLLDLTFIGWLIFIVSYAISVGVHASQAVYLPVAASAGGLAGRIGTGFLVLWRPHWSPAVYASLTMLSALALFAYTIDSSLINLLFCSILAGFGLFGATAMYYAMLAEMVDENHFAGLVALSYFFTGIGNFLSGPVTGLMFDITGSFPFAFRILGSIMAILSTITFMYLYYDYCRAKSQQHQSR
ncbi:monocarboxylate transporter 7-like [Lytechinus variegatus]|uniref:monocarboxylate transporter 7-like n=1 Tax=Lytechinus variegatus TaxID=7654 RepID=UPI001BB0F7CB|nr:monocarboxylate transporter 7-like [Lytechinus variegatus]